MRYWEAAILCLAIAPGMAKADITAVYATQDASVTLKVEVAANGDFRMQRTPGRSTDLYREGHFYSLQDGPNGPIVSRNDTMKAVFDELAAKAGVERKLQPAILQLEEKGTTTVNGRTGDVYYLRAPDGTLSRAPVAIISHDPSLAALGQAVALKFRMAAELNSGIDHNTATKLLMAEILRKGTAIEIAGMDLQSVSDAPIPASEFALPGPVETLDQTRARLTKP